MADVWRRNVRGSCTASKRPPGRAGGAWGTRLAPQNLAALSPMMALVSVRAVGDPLLCATLPQRRSSHSLHLKAPRSHQTVVLLLLTRLLLSRCSL